MIYFLESECGLKIKIGFTERTGHDRLAELRSNCGDITLIGEIPGDMSLERDLHSVYEKDRLHGEWFAATTTLRNHITRLMGVTAPIIIGYTKPDMWGPSAPVYDNEPDPKLRAEAATNPHPIQLPRRTPGNGWPKISLLRRKP